MRLTRLVTLGLLGLSIASVINPQARSSSVTGHVAISTLNHTTSESASLQTTPISPDLPSMARVEPSSSPFPPPPWSPPPPANNLNAAAIIDDVDMTDFTDDEDQNENTQHHGGHGGGHGGHGRGHSTSSHTGTSGSSSDGSNGGSSSGARGGGGAVAAGGAASGKKSDGVKLRVEIGMLGVAGGVVVMGLAGLLG